MATKQRSIIFQFVAKPTDLKFCPDGTYLAIVCSSGILVIFLDPENAGKTLEFYNHVCDEWDCFKTPSAEWISNEKFRINDEIFEIPRGSSTLTIDFYESQTVYVNVLQIPEPGESRPESFTPKSCPEIPTKEVEAGGTICRVRAKDGDVILEFGEHSRKLNSKTKGFSISDGLTNAEQDDYKILLGHAEAIKATGGKAPGIVVISDLAKDYDDLAAMIVLKELHRSKNVKLEAYITNLEPARKRAIYGRAALDSLGLQHVPIGVGTKASTKKHEEYEYEFDALFMPNEKTFQPNKDNFFEDGFELLDLVFNRAIQEDGKIDLLLISSLTDIAEYTDTEDRLKTFQKAVGRVYMQGGYSISAKDIPTPRDDAANNTFDMPAAERFHPRLKNIPSAVYTKVAAYATNIPASIFNDLGDTKHPIGKDLQNRYQRQGIQFYKTACGPKPVNGITQEKFLHNLSSFYNCHPPGIQASEKGTPLPEDGTPLPDPGDDFDPNQKFEADKYEIIPYLTKGLMYDALPALATGGGNLVKALDVLDTESMANQTSIHKVIGTPKQDDLPANPNIHPERMAFVISTILKGGLYDSVKNGPGSQLKE